MSSDKKLDYKKLYEEEKQRYLHQVIESSRLLKKIGELQEQVAQMMLKGE